MATRRPLAVISGVITEMPDGDTIPDGMASSSPPLHVLSEDTEVPADRSYIVMQTLELDLDVVLEVAANGRVGVL